MKRPVMVIAVAVGGVIAAAASAQTLRDYAAIYGARGGDPVDLRGEDVDQTVQTGPEGRYAKPQPGSEPRGTGRDYGYQDYGRISGGFAEYGSEDFPTPPPEEEGEEAADEPAEAEAEEQAGEEEDEFAVSEGFFFDNFTSGAGFGVYGGEAVGSGTGTPLNLPSAGNRAQELGFQTGSGGTTTPPPAGGETDPEG